MPGYLLFSNPSRCPISRLFLISPFRSHALFSHVEPSCSPSHNSQHRLTHPRRYFFHLASRILSSHLLAAGLFSAMLAADHPLEGDWLKLQVGARSPVCGGVTVCVCVCFFFLRVSFSARYYLCSRCTTSPPHPTPRSSNDPVRRKSFVRGKLLYFAMRNERKLVRSLNEPAITRYRTLADGFREFFRFFSCPLYLCVCVR